MIRAIFIHIPCTGQAIDLIKKKREKKDKGC
jgi:hypothetical protein